MKAIIILDFEALKQLDLFTLNWDFIQKIEDDQYDAITKAIEQVADDSGLEMAKL